MPLRDRKTGDDLTAAVVRCRTYGHAWDEFAPVGMDDPAYGWRLSLRCIRCTTERHDVIDTIGAVSERRYIHPDGYDLATGTDHRLTRPEYRQMLYERIRNRRAKGIKGIA